MTTIRYVEELAMNACPSLATYHQDGWTLKWANGYTRRANSVYPLQMTSESIEESVRQCESFYFSHQLPTHFKLTSDSSLESLDDYLEQQGYVYEGQSFLQIIDIPSVTCSSVMMQVTEEATVSEAWLKSFNAMNQSSQNVHEQKALYDTLSHTTCYFTAFDNGEIVGHGLVVYENGEKWVGLFQIAISPAHRQKGLGKALVAHMLDWGTRHGAKKAYLQVLANNLPALRLYESLGFRKLYSYWYRTKHSTNQNKVISSEKNYVTTLKRPPAKAGGFGHEMSTTKVVTKTEVILKHLMLKQAESD
ncbi:GNAT family N-acetyltransferase [Aureibacillus halotolerans]|uniref:Acetyltransferase (GNAT) family protein n=1 Tax=Aureibacillus halotolerans TaxID=1508390 RepID=A0A4R6U0I3_9BACI|nr:GNAT family N-acetyltransferase [Aureibacillus halotolerans]TDQ36564.1 acetyltransferase (GNAT) family protein [Aureibacillus halotolerans]